MFSYDVDATRLSRHQLSSFLSIDCSLFALCFRTPSFISNNLQPLFRKHPGWGWLPGLPTFVRAR